MTHLPHLISDLALILGAGALVTLIFKWLKQPLVLGYIIAGFLVGPNVPIMPTVIEEENIRILAELGVIFLLFSLGLEFSFKKLIKVGGSSSITAVFEVVFMVLLGYGTGKVLGWSNMDSLFLGGILSISSTTIIIRAFEELGVKTQRFASLVFGVLIVEDLVAIVLMVLLSTLAVSRQFSGNEMMFSILKLIFFLVIWFVSGIFFIPTILRATKRLLSEETLLIVSIALCLLMVVLANRAGFSPALGAFIMGSILAETTKAEKIEHLVKPVKDLFGAIFFISVGMLIDPAMLVNYAGPIVLISVITIAGKIFSTACGALLSGQSLQTSVQAGFSLAQIGEFSFIIATLGLTLNVTSGFLYPIAVAVSAVTTLTTPFFINSSHGVYRKLTQLLPQKLQQAITNYSSETRTATVTSDWKMILRANGINIVLLSIILLSVVLVSEQYILTLALRYINNEAIAKPLIAFTTLVIMAPFLWGLAIKNIYPDYYLRQTPEKRHLGPLVGFRILRLGLAAFFVAFLLYRFFYFNVAIIITVCILVILIGFSKKVQRFYNRLELRFNDNLNQREIAEAKNNKEELAPWDARIVRVKVQSDSSCVGHTLDELRWREKLGINIVMIKRGDRQISVPNKNERLFPDDDIYILGTDFQINRLQVTIRPLKDPAPSNGNDTEMVLRQLPVNIHSPLIGVNIRDSGIKEKIKGLVVGIERDGDRILNPESDLRFQGGDSVFIVGDQKYIAGLEEI